MPHTRAYSHYSQKAAALMGKSIQLHRKERQLTAQDLSNRAGISRTTLRKIENGDMGCEIGLVFEVAALAGVRLFDVDSKTIDSRMSQLDDKIALLPKTIRVSRESIDDDF